MSDEKKKDPGHAPEREGSRSRGGGASRRLFDRRTKAKSTVEKPACKYLRIMVEPGPQARTATGSTSVFPMKLIRGRTQFAASSQARPRKHQPGPS